MARFRQSQWEARLTSLQDSRVEPITSDRRLLRVLENAGWGILSIEIDLTREIARIELKSHAGRLVTFDARNGKATITTEQLCFETEGVGRRGDRFLADRVRVRFVGRQRCGFGVRSGLKLFAEYLAENSPAQLVTADARNAMRCLLGGKS